jgi:chromosome partitioning protein
MAQEGLRVIGVDLDPQGTLSKWFARREKTAERNPNLASFDLMPADLTQWERVVEAVSDYDVAVIDTLPSVKHAIGDVRALCEAADLVLVTTGATMSDIDSTMPWARELGSLGIRFALCMNRANRRELFFAEARAHLNRLGRLCPVEVRNLSDAHAFSVDGLSAADKPKSKARVDFVAVWDFVRREVGVGAEVAA